MNRPDQQKAFKEAYPDATDQDMTDLANETMTEQLDTLAENTETLEEQHEKLTDVVENGTDLLKQLDQAYKDVSAGRPVTFPSENGKFTNELLENAKNKSHLNIDPSGELTFSQIEELIGIIERSNDAYDKEASTMELENGYTANLATSFTMG